MRLKTRDTGGGRGLWVAEFADEYGKACSIQDSSLATEPCIWLGCNENDPSGSFPRMHLSQKHVSALLPLLQYFAKWGRLPRERKPRPRKKGTR